MREVWLICGLLIFTVAVCVCISTAIVTANHGGVPPLTTQVWLGISGAFIVGYITAATSFFKD